MGPAKHLAVLAALLSAACASADRWGPVPTKWTSPDWKFASRCEEEFAVLSLVDLTGAKPRVLWTKKSPLEGYPHHVVFSPDGQYVVLIDRHGGLGRDKVLAIIGPGGVTRATYQLRDFLPGSEVSHASRSISSIHWRQAAPAFVREDTPQFILFSSAGTLRVFDLPTGRRVKLTKLQEVEMRQDAARRYRPRLTTHEWGAMELGVIGDRRDGPALLKLMEVSEDPGLLAHAYQLLMRDDSAPGFEKLAHDPNHRDHLATWIRSMPDGPKGRAALRRLAMVEPAIVARNTTIEGLWSAADVRRNVHWVSSSDPSLRWFALRTLFADPISSDLPIIERGLKSDDSAEQHHAFHALIAVDPPDLNRRLQVLRNAPTLRNDVTLQLARLGDPRAIDEIRVDLTTRRKGSGLLTYFHFKDACRLIVDRRFAWGRSALQQYSGDLNAKGALAGFGDLAALLSIRHAAENGRYPARMDALDWLVFLKDSEASRLLHLATNDEDPELASWAADALHKLP